MAFYKTFYYSTFICVTLFSFSCYSLAKEFTIIALDDFNGIEQIIFQDKSSSQKVSVRKFSSNRSFPIPDSKVIYFYAVDPKTKISSNKPLFKISFEDQKNECIVFLTEDKNKPEKISYEFLNFDTKSFPKVSTFMINLTNQKVVTKLGNSIVKLSPYSKKLVTLPQNERGSFTEYVVFAAQPQNKEIDYFYSSFWRIPKGKRTLSIVEIDKETNRLKLNEILIP